MKTAAIVLAAGKSSRMGRNKLLLKLDGKTILEHILSKLTEYPTLVVTGHKPEEIRPIIRRFGVKEVYNSRYSAGMTTSFQAGLSKLDPDIDAAFLVLGDTFGFSKELLEEMIIAMEQHKDTLLVSPKYQGKRGHPVLVRRPLFSEFLRLDSGETMKNLVDRHSDEHRYFEGSIWCRVDLDTEEDYEAVRRLWKAKRA